MTDRVTVFVPGKIYWAKILGDPVDNYEHTGKEWTYEFEPDDVSFLKENKLLDRLKSKYKDQGRGDFLTLRKPELDKDGNKNEPIRVYDKENNPWDSTKLIGNGSKVLAKLSIVDWGRGKKSSIYTTALRIEDHIPYASSEFGAYDSSEKSVTKPEGKAVSKKASSEKVFELDDIDDDLPF